MGWLAPLACAANATFGRKQIISRAEHAGDAEKDNNNSLSLRSLRALRDTINLLTAIGL